MQQAAFQAAGIQADYLALDVRDFAAGWNAVRRLEIAGGNVTAPWKDAAATALDEPAPGVLRERSANTFWRTAGGRLAGTTTDGEGLLRALREAFARDVTGLRVAVLGAGGAGRSAVHALAGADAALVYLWNRSRERAVRLAAEVAAAGYPADRLVVLSDGPPRAPDVDLLVNATPVGARPFDPSPADPAAFPGLRFAMDLVYGPQPTEFQRECARAGARTSDGRGMLLHQGALAFELWFGRAAPLEVMRRALEAALRR